MESSDGDTALLDSFQREDGPFGVSEGVWAMSEWAIDHERIKDPNARSKYGTESAQDKRADMSIGPQIEAIEKMTVERAQSYLDDWGGAELKPVEIDGEFYFLALIHPYWIKKLRLGSRKIRRYFHQMNEAWKRGLIPKEKWMWRQRP